MTKLVIFLKAPRLGSVKTRLAASIGEDAACAAYKKLVEQLVKNLRDVPNIELRFALDYNQAQKSAQTP